RGCRPWTDRASRYVRLIPVRVLALHAPLSCPPSFPPIAGSPGMLNIVGNYSRLRPPTESPACHERAPRRSQCATAGPDTLPDSGESREADTCGVPATLCVGVPRGMHRVSVRG